MRATVLALISLVLAETAMAGPARAAPLNHWPQRGVERAIKDIGWLYDNSFGFGIRIDSWTLTCNEPFMSPDIYLFIDAKDFNEDNLTKVFAGFSELYDHAAHLRVTAISDIGVLRKLTSIFALLGSEPEAFIPGTGYLGAFFQRSDDEGVFQYTPLADTPDLVQVTLKSKDKLAAKPELKAAVATGDTRKLRELFDEGEGVKFKNILRLTPLIYAAREGSAKTIEKIVAEGAEIDARDRYGRTALLESAFLGNTDAIDVLLKSHADISSRDNHQNSALILAVYSGRLEAVKLLLASGADIRAKDDTGATALMIAKRKKRDPAIIQMLESAEGK